MMTESKTAAKLYTDGEAIYRSSGKYDDLKKAIEYFDEAIKSDATFTDAWNGKANALNSIGKSEESIECYDEVLRINRNKLSCICNGKANALIIINSMEGCAKRENERYAEVVRINRDLGHASRNKGIALSRLGREDKAKECFEEAISYYKNILDENSRNDPRIYNAIGISFDDLGKYDKAIEYFDKAIEIDPSFDYAYYNKGHVLNLLDRYEEAIECFRKVIDNLNAKKVSFAII